MFRNSWKLLSSQLIIKRFAGHSKWANIKHDKAIKDAEKSNLFGKFTRMIRVGKFFYFNLIEKSKIKFSTAIQENGNNNNPATNSQLKAVIDQALQKDMPMATIEKNIKRFNPSDMKLKKEFVDIKTLNKVFLVVEIFSDQIAKVKMDINTFVRKNKSLGTTLADIKHSFEEAGIVIVTSKETFANSSEFEDKLTEDAINADAQEVEDIDFESKTATFVCKPIEIDRVKRDLMNLGYVIEEAQHVFVPQRVIQLTDDENEKYQIMLQKLKAIEGVEGYFDNVEPNE